MEEPMTQTAIPIPRRIRRSRVWYVSPCVLLTIASDFFVYSISKHEKDQTKESLLFVEKERKCVLAISDHGD